jgi:hypothetical protein
MAEKAGEARTAKLVINQLMKENRKRETACYLVIGAWTLASLALAGWGAWLQSPWLVGAALGGGGLSMIVPMRSTLYLWRTNAAIRLLELPLDRATTATDAAAMLYKCFPDVFKGEG